MDEPDPTPGDPIPGGPRPDELDDSEIVAHPEPKEARRRAEWGNGPEELDDGQADELDDLQVDRSVPLPARHRRDSAEDLDNIPLGRPKAPAYSPRDMSAPEVRAALRACLWVEQVAEAQALGIARSPIEADPERIEHIRAVARERGITIEPIASPGPPPAPPRTSSKPAYPYRKGTNLGSGDRPAYVEISERGDGVIRYLFQQLGDRLPVEQGETVDTTLYPLGRTVVREVLFLLTVEAAEELAERLEKSKTRKSGRIPVDVEGGELQYHPQGLNARSSAGEVVLIETLPATRGRWARALQEAIPFAEAAT